MMRLRTCLFLGLATAHGVLGALAHWSVTFGPAFAITVYGPLWALGALGLPVSGATPSGGWPAPSMLGWACVVLLWCAVWWGVAALLARVCRPCRTDG